MQFTIKTGRGLAIGLADVASSAGNLMTGTFTSTPDFAHLAALFDAHQQAADAQTLTDVDRIEREIAQHAFYVIGPLPMNIRTDIDDLQIMESGISFRLRQPRPDAAPQPPASPKAGQ